MGDCATCVFGAGVEEGTLIEWDVCATAAIAVASAIGITAAISGSATFRVERQLGSTGQKDPDSASASGSEAGSADGKARRCAGDGAAARAERGGNSMFDLVDDCDTIGSISTLGSRTVSPLPVGNTLHFTFTRTNGNDGRG